MRQLRILYPYNEILPKKKAHDVFIFQECAAFEKKGAAVTLLCGKGSARDSALFQYYGEPKASFEIKQLAIVRKNNVLRLSWNLPFFLLTQREIKIRKPDFVFLSVFKQGLFHLQHKIPHVRYVYEVHELTAYPHVPYDKKQCALEKKMLSLCDLIVVTTEALKEILQKPPYSLTNRIEVVGLAVHAAPLSPPENTTPLTLFYVGGLYEGQGVDCALEALAKTTDVHLKIVGGRPHEIFGLKQLAEKYNIAKKVTFLGFKQPKDVAKSVQDASAFIAPFRATGRMPYVAHTKLCEYATWGRPIIAPDVEAVRAHFGQNGGALLFKPDDINALAAAMEALKSETLRAEMQREIGLLQSNFSWDLRAESYFQLLN